MLALAAAPVEQLGNMIDAEFSTDEPVPAAGAAPAGDDQPPT